MFLPDIFINRIDISRLKLPECDFTVECSKGTYIRTLCADIGEKLNVGGVLTRLRRLRSGRFELKDALTVEQLKTMEQPDLEQYLAKTLVKLAGELA